MPTTTTITENYAGKEAGELMLQTLRETDTLRLGLMSIAENVGYELNLRLIETSLGAREYSCGFIPAGSTVVTNKVLKPSKIKNDFQICKEDFRATWSQESMGASASNPNVPNDIMEAIQVEVLQKEAIKINSEMWVGTGADGQIGGVIPLLVADADVIKPTPLGAAITESNVRDELKKVLAAIPTALLRTDLNIVVSPDVFQAYWFDLVTRGINNDGNTDPKRVGFGRYTLTEVNDLPDNTIIAYKQGNLIYATGAQSDFNNLTVKDEDEIGLLTGMVRGTMVYSGAAGYYNSGDIVFYQSI